MRLFLSIASNTSQLFRSSHNSWKRHIHAGLPVQGSHRPRLLDAEAEKQLLEYLGERGKEGNAVTMSEFPSVVRTYAEQTADRAGMNSFGVTEPSLSSLKRLRKRLGLLRRNAVSSQALRRLEVTRCDTPFLVTVNACMHACIIPFPHPFSGQLRYAQLRLYGGGLQRGRWAHQCPSWYTTPLVFQL